ncbi:MAG: hypothetical protein QXG00_05930 [Candidatus Woesearchaeota archaeon]
MGNGSYNSLSITQSVVNNVFENQQNDCIVNNNVTISGNVIDINGANIQGDAYGITDEGSSADASCTIVSSLNTTIVNSLQAQAKQENKTLNDMFGDFSFTGQENKADVKQSTVNNIALISQNLCQAEQMTSVENNFVYYNNINVGGNLFGIDISNSSAQASCSMSNVMNFSMYNSFTASVSQSNTTIGMFVVLILAIAGVVGLAIIGATIVFSVSGIGSFAKSKIKPKSPLEVVEEKKKELEAELFEKGEKKGKEEQEEQEEQEEYFPEEEGIEMKTFKK